MKENKNFKKKIGWNELAKKTSEESGIPVPQIHEVVNAIYTTMENLVRQYSPELVLGDKNSYLRILTPLGAHTLRYRGSTTKVNPQTGDKINIDACVACSMGVNSAILVAANSHLTKQKEQQNKLQAMEDKNNMLKQAA